MSGDRGHMRTMRLLPFAAAAYNVQMTGPAAVHRLLSVVRRMYVQHRDQRKFVRRTDAYGPRNA
jgi:hypothetical protein